MVARRSSRSPRSPSCFNCACHLHTDRRMRQFDLGRSLPKWGSRAPFFIQVRLHNDLIELSFGDYDLAIQKFVHDAHKVPGVRYLGQFGSIKTPGVSDVDLLVITDDDQFILAREAVTRIAANVPRGSYL